MKNVAKNGGIYERRISLLSCFIRIFIIIVCNFFYPFCFFVALINILMSDTKIIPLTEIELQTLANAKFFVIKQSVTKKIQQQFHLLKNNLQLEVEHCKNTIPPEADISTGRIFKGENYKGFPYIMLDYPRLFDKNQVFAFRNMCWWGKHFSFTLHLSGKPLDNCRISVSNNIHRLNGKGFYYCINNTPWEYHYEEDNYKSLDELLQQNPLEFKKDIFQKDFIKLSRKLEISCYEDILACGQETFKLCLEIMNQD